MAKTIDIVVPDLGDFSDVEVIEILVSSGDRVEKEDGLITLETDKAAMDVPAEENGVIEELTVSTGDSVSTGTVIGRLKVDDDGDADDGDDAEKSHDDDAAGAEEQAEQQDGSDSAGSADAQDDGGSREDGDGDGDGDGDDDGDGEQRNLVVPDIGDFDEVEVIEVHVSAGDDIAEEDALVTLETDKAAMDVPAEAAGRVESVHVNVGDKVSEGSKLVSIIASGGSKRASTSDKKTDAERHPESKDNSGDHDGDAGAAPTEPDRKSAAAMQTPPAKPTDAAAPKQLPPVNEPGFARAHASPSVRKLARELGVDLAQVKGSGVKSRILHDDVKAFVKAVLSGQQAAPAGAAALPQVPSVDFAKFGEIETQPLTRIQKISGPRLQASWINLPHVTQHDLADITALEAKRQKLKGPAKERGIPLTPLAFVIKACISALKEFPKVNASLSEDGKNLVVKKYYHIGFAADTDDGLMVPVIRDADTKDVYELAAALKELSSSAREGKLKAADLQGATFTISSLGGIGGTAFTPIVNAPEVAILGVSRSTMQPVWNGKSFEPRLLLPLSLSYDHRVIDGAAAVRFTTFLGEALGDVDALLQAIP